MALDVYANHYDRESALLTSHISFVAAVLVLWLFVGLFDCLFACLSLLCFAKNDF